MRYIHFPHFLITLNFTAKKNNLRNAHEPTKTLERIQFKRKKRSSHIVSGIPSTILTMHRLCSQSTLAPLSINLHALPVNSLSSLPSHSTTHRLSPPFVFLSLGSEFSSPCLSPLGHSTRPGSTKLLLVRRGATVVGGGVDARRESGGDKRGEGRAEGRIPSRSLSGLEKPI